MPPTNIFLPKNTFLLASELKSGGGGLDVVGGMGFKPIFPIFLT